MLLAGQAVMGREGFLVGVCVVSQLLTLAGAGRAAALLTAGWIHCYHVRAPERAWNSKRVGEALP